MVFVISDDIKAEYLPPNVRVEGLGLPTDLVDEWRCLENIPLSKIIGIAVPLDSLKKALEGKDSMYSIEEIKELREILIELKGICNKIGLKVYNSEEENFTDKLDAKLQKEKSTESKSIQNDEEIK